MKRFRVGVLLLLSSRCREHRHCAVPPRRLVWAGVHTQRPSPVAAPVTARPATEGPGGKFAPLPCPVTWLRLAGAGSLRIKMGPLGVLSGAVPVAFRVQVADASAAALAGPRQAAQRGVASSPGGLLPSDSEPGHWQPGHW